MKNLKAKKRKRKREKVKSLSRPKRDLDKINTKNVNCSKTLKKTREKVKNLSTQNVLFIHAIRIEMKKSISYQFARIQKISFLQIIDAV